MPNKNIILMLILLFFATDASICQQKASWQIWIVPNTYTLNCGDTLHVAFGITGYGSLDPIHLKVAAYSEENTLIKWGNQPGQYEVYIIAPEENAPKDRFTKRDPKAHPHQIILESDHNSEFGCLFLIPKTSGDKKLTLIATYSPDSISWYTTSRELNYHVNSFTERHQIMLAIAGIVVALLAIGPSVFKGYILPFCRLFKHFINKNGGSLGKGGMTKK